MEGKVALVTGASKGIGKAIAQGLADAGASVMLVSRKIDQLEAAAADIGGDTAVYAANAGDIDAAERVRRCHDRTVRWARHPRQQRRDRTRTTAPRSMSSRVSSTRRSRSTFVVRCTGLAGGSSAGAGRPTRCHRQHRVRRRTACRSRARGLPADEGRADPPHETARTRTRADPRGRHRTWPGRHRLRCRPGRQLRRPVWPKRCRSGGSGNRSDIADLAVFLASDKASWITGDTYVIDGAGVRGDG